MGETIRVGGREYGVGTSIRAIVKRVPRMGTISRLPDRKNPHAVEIRDAWSDDPFSVPYLLLMPWNGVKEWEFRGVDGQNVCVYRVGQEVEASRYPDKSPIRGYIFGFNDRRNLLLPVELAYPNGEGGLSYASFRFEELKAILPPVALAQSA